MLFERILRKVDDEGNGSYKTGGRNGWIEDGLEVQMKCRVETVVKDRFGTDGTTT